MGVGLGVGLKDYIRRTDHDTSGQLLFLSVCDPYMAHSSLGPVSGFAQNLRLDFSDLRSCFFCFLGPAGSDDSCFQLYLDGL